MRGVDLVAAVDVAGAKELCGALAQQLGLMRPAMASGENHAGRSEATSQD